MLTLYLLKYFEYCFVNLTLVEINQYISTNVNKFNLENWLKPVEIILLKFIEIVAIEIC
jgi:hypothetical protein